MTVSLLPHPLYERAARASAVCTPLAPAKSATSSPAHRECTASLHPLGCPASPLAQARASPQAPRSTVRPPRDIREGQERAVRTRPVRTCAGMSAPGSARSSRAASGSRSYPPAASSPCPAQPRRPPTLATATSSSEARSTLSHLSCPSLLLSFSRPRRSLGCSRQSAGSCPRRARGRRAARAVEPGNEQCVVRALSARGTC